MTPRLMVVCLGGLAGAGAVVCCDLDEGLEPAESLDGEAAEEPVEPVEAVEAAAAEADGPVVH